MLNYWQSHYGTAGTKRVRDRSFYFSTEFTESWASLPHAVQTSQGPLASVSPGASCGAVGGPLGATSLWVYSSRNREARILPISHLGHSGLSVEQWLVLGHPEVGQTRTRNQPGAHARRLGCLPLSLKDAPPLLPALPAHGLPGRGGALPAPVTPSPRQRGHTGPNGPGAWAAAARPRGQSRQHGQSLRGGGGRLPGPGVPQQKGGSRRLRRSGPLPQGEGAVWGCPCQLRAVAEGEPLPAAPCPGDARRERHFLGPAETTFPRSHRWPRAAPAGPPATPARGRRPAQDSRASGGVAARGLGAEAGSWGRPGAASSRPVKAQPPCRGPERGAQACLPGPVARPGTSTLPGKKGPRREPRGPKHAPDSRTLQSCPSAVGSSGVAAVVVLNFRCFAPGEFSEYSKVGEVLSKPSAVEVGTPWERGRWRLLRKPVYPIPYRVH